MISRKQFAHELIPSVLQFGLNEGGGEAVAAMLHKDFWEGMMEHAHPDGADFDWNEFAVEGIDYDDRLVAIVFEFPLPLQEEEARWGVIFIAKQGGKEHNTSHCNVPCLTAGWYALQRQKGRSAYTFLPRVPHVRNSWRSWQHKCECGQVWKVQREGTDIP